MRYLNVSPWNIFTFARQNNCEAGHRMFGVILGIGLVQCGISKVNQGVVRSVYGFIPHLEVVSD